jgi:hypothetical protein
MTRCRALVLCVVAVLSTMLSGPSPACGDKLVALGGGVRFEQVVVSRHPGRILMILSPGSALAEANSRFNLTSSLTLVGHSVITAEDVAEIDQILLDGPLDLVLVDATELRGVALRSSATGQGPTILPVAFQGGPTPQPKTGLPAGCTADAGERNGKTLLKTVEKTLARRSRGEPDSCIDSPTGHRT